MAASILIPAIYVPAGMCAYAAAVHVQTALKRPDKRELHLTFAAACVAVVFYQAATAGAFSASRPAAFLSSFRLLVESLLIASAFLLWFALAYTGRRLTRRHAALALLFLPGVVLDRWLPHGLLYDALPELKSLTLPWGETATVAAPGRNPWVLVYALPFNGTLLYITVILGRHWRRQRSGAALAMFLALVFDVALALQGLATRLGWLDMLPLGQFAYAFVPLAMGLVLQYERQREDGRLRAIIDHVPAVVTMRAPDGRYLLANRYFCERIGREEQELIGRDRHALAAPSDTAFAAAHDAQVRAAGRAMEFEEEAPLGGQMRIFQSIRFPVLDEDRRLAALCTVANDITERKRAERELERHRHHLEDLVAERTAEIARLANHDALTGLPTRRLATDRLAVACAQARRDGHLAALLFIDLDGFKAANDNHGHDAGDAVLKTVAARLGACVREADTVARQGGDEFLVILGGLGDTTAAEQIAAKMLAAIAEPIRHGEATIPIGASIGIAFYPDHGQDNEELMRRADQAMYAVKKSGKNRYALAA